MIPLADLRLESIAGLPVAHLSGEIDRSNAAELGDRVASAIGEESGGLVVDLSELEFIDSTGIRMLFGLATQLISASSRCVWWSPTARTSARSSTRWG